MGCTRRAEYYFRGLLFLTLGSILGQRKFGITAVQRCAHLVGRSNCCGTRIVNYYFLAKFGFDTAENGSAQNCVLTRARRRLVIEM